MTSCRSSYASVGGATGHTVVGLCMYLSVRRQDFLLLTKTKRCNVQHKLKSIFA